MAENDLHAKVEEHDHLIHEIRMNQVAAKAEVDTRLSHLEAGQREQLHVLLRVESKVDGNTNTLGNHEAGLKVGRWVVGVGLTAIGVGIAIANYFFGGKP